MADRPNKTGLGDGGPAFPRFGMNSWEKPSTLEAGMSLRAWFAGQALAGILAGGFADTIPHDDVNGGGDAAFFAVQYADALLAALAIPPSCGVTPYEIDAAPEFLDAIWEIPGFVPGSSPAPLPASPVSL